MTNERKPVNTPACIFTYKRKKGHWYIHLPKYSAHTGLQEEWLPIHTKGMDTFLYAVAEGENTLTLEIRTTPFSGADELELLQVLAGKKGAYYLLKTFRGKPYVLQLFFPQRFCYYFDTFPKHLYWKTINL